MGEMKDVDDEAFGLCIAKIRECASRSRVLTKDVYSPTGQSRQVLVHQRMAQIFDRIADAEEAAR